MKSKEQETLENDLLLILRKTRASERFKAIMNLLAERCAISAGEPEPQQGTADYFTAIDKYITARVVEIVKE